MLSPCVLVVEVTEGCSSLIHRKPAVVGDRVAVLAIFDVGNAVVVIVVPAAVAAFVFSFSVSFLFARCSARYIYTKKTAACSN